LRNSLANIGQVMSYFSKVMIIYSLIAVISSFY